MTPKLVAPLLSSETRLDGASLRVSRLLPCSDFDLQGIAIWDAPIPARAAEDSNLNLRHVEPACVFWRAVKLHAAPKIVGRLRTQHLGPGKTTHVHGLPPATGAVPWREYPRRPSDLPRSGAIPSGA